MNERKSAKNARRLHKKGTQHLLTNNLSDGFRWEQLLTMSECVRLHSNAISFQSQCVLSVLSCCSATFDYSRSYLGDMGLESSRQFSPSIFISLQSTSTRDCHGQFCR